MCSDGTKRHWFHDWSKWEEKSVMNIRHVQSGGKRQVRLQERTCNRCGLTQVDKIGDTADLMS